MQVHLLCTSTVNHARHHLHTSTANDRKCGHVGTLEERVGRGGGGGGTEGQSDTHTFNDPFLAFSQSHATYTHVVH